MDAVSLSTNSHRLLSNTPDVRSTATAAEARAVVAALAAPQPVTRVAMPTQAAEEIGDLSFLYAPNGLPSHAVPSAQATTDARVTSGGNPTARLAFQSTEIDSLMSSFLTARAPSANPAPSPDVPAETGNAQLAQIARQSVIAQLYSQF